jgi:hypothetical protein
MNAEIEDFLEGFNQPTYRGMRVCSAAISMRPATVRMGIPVGSERVKRRDAVPKPVMRLAALALPRW